MGRFWDIVGGFGILPEICEAAISPLSIKIILKNRFEAPEILTFLEKYDIIYIENERGSESYVNLRTYFCEIEARRLR